MNQYYSIKGDYLQRTRSYAFLITIAISVYIAYSFVPPQGANYTTVRIGDYVGKPNAAWIGHVTAVMTSLFLSLTGFFLVNSGIKKDIETKVGMIIAATSVSNFRYLLSKALSNLLVLTSIMGVVFMMSIGLFFVRGDGYTFDLMSFVLPYLIITLPSLAFVSALAVAGEVFVGRSSMMQYLLFFFIFNAIIGTVASSSETNLVQLLDPFGVKAVTMNMHDFVKTHYDPSAPAANIGFVFSDKISTIPFTFENMKWSASFIVSRLIWISISLGLVYVSSLFFHRFDLKEGSRRKTKEVKHESEVTSATEKSIRVSQLPGLVSAHGIGSFIKTELVLLYRKGSRWFWLVNAGVMIGLLAAPISVAHQFILPVIWFLQVVRVSDLSAKEKMNDLHYFTYASFQPLKRLLSAQIIAGVILFTFLASPLIVRLIITGEALSILRILLGAVVIVLTSVCFGIVTGGKKLFEIFFFLLTYCNLNRIPFADYFGGTDTSPNQLLVVSIISLGLATISYAFRNYELRNA